MKVLMLENPIKFRIEEPSAFRLGQSIFNASRLSNERSLA